MALIDFLTSDFGRLISCFIVGLGLSLMFRKVCEGPECVIVKGPPVSQIKDKVFKFDEKCYTYSTVATSCKNQSTNKK